MKTDTLMINPPSMWPLGRIICRKGIKKSTRLHMPDALSSFSDRIQYSTGQRRREDDIGATLDDICTTCGDIFFHMKNANVLQKFI